MNKQCYTDEYYFWIFVMIIPILILVTIVYSLTTFILLYRSKNKIYNLYNFKINLRFGYLLQGYKKKSWWWEYVKMY